MKYLVRCEVNMDINRYATVIVKSTNPYVACQIAEEKLRKSGYFHARAFSCKEMEEENQ